MIDCLAIVFPIDVTDEEEEEMEVEIHEDEDFDEKNKTGEPVKKKTKFRRTSMEMRDIYGT